MTTDTARGYAFGVRALPTRRLSDRLAAHSYARDSLAPNALFAGRARHPDEACTQPVVRRRRVVKPCDSCGLKVCLIDPVLLPELAHHFERSGFSVERLPDAVAVEPRGDVSTERGEWEIASHLRVWLVMHPGSTDEGDSGLAAPALNIRDL